MTLRDFASVGQLVVENGRDVIPSTWIEDIATAGSQEAWREGEWGEAFRPISPHMRYRNGWYVIDAVPQLPFAMGIHGQNLFLDRANRIVIAKFSSQAQPTDYRAIGLTHMTVSEIRRLLS